MLLLDAEILLREIIFVMANVLKFQTLYSILFAFYAFVS